jgi:hypothetical protein
VVTDITSTTSDPGTGMSNIDPILIVEVSTKLATDGLRETF